MKKIYLYVFLFVCFCMLLYTTSPSVNSGDSGEFITTAVTLGINHSPGYPLYSLLGKIFSSLIPFGNYAYRINVMNIFFSLLAVYLIFLIGKNVYENDKMKMLNLIISTGILVFSKSFWRNTVQTEVFILNIMVAVLILFIVLSKMSIIKKWCLVSFIFALGLGNHHTLVFIFPGLIYMFYEENKNYMLLKNFLKCILFFILGFSVYIMLPLRSEKNPGLDWGNTETLTNLYRVITRKDYGTFQLMVEKPLPRDVKNTFKQIVRFTKSTLEDIPLPIFLLGCTGLIILYIKNRRTSVLFLSSIFFSGLGFFILSNIPFEPLHNGILERFYILPNTLFIISFLISLLYVTKYFLGIVLISVLCLGYNIYENYNKCNYRNYFLNYDYGTNILHSIMPNGIFFMDGGDDTFYTLAYLQFVEHRRKDVALHDRGGLVFKSVYGKDFRNLTKEEKETRRVEIEKSYVNLRPVYYSTFNLNILPSEKLLPAGLLYVVESPIILNRGFNSDLITEICSYRSLFQEYYEYRSKALVPVFLFLKAKNSKDVEEKVRLMKYSYFLWPEVDWLKNNVGIELHNLGFKMFNENKYEIAKKIYETLILMNSKDSHAMLNLGVVYEKVGNYSLAEEIYLKVVDLEPQNANAYYNLAVLYWGRKDWDKVINNFQKVVELQPANNIAKNYLYRAMIEKNKK